MPKKFDRNKTPKGSVDYQSKNPIETERSKGYFYVRHYKKSGNWKLYFESWKDGKKLQEPVPEVRYQSLGFLPTMTYEQARQAVKHHNFTRKGELKITRAEINAHKRYLEITTQDKILFPPQIAKEFLDRLERSNAKDKHKTKMKNLFFLTQVITSKLKLQPFKYNDRIDEVLAYIKDKKYSVSYSKDIIYMMNKWGSFYSKQTGKFFEPIGKIVPNTQRAIIRENNLKGRSVRRPSLPLTEEILEEVYRKSKDDLEQMKNYNWLRCSFYFGLRPSELDEALECPVVEEHISGVEILVVEQTKLIIKDEERIKRIPVITSQQKECIEIIKSGDAKAIRPDSEWVNKVCRMKNKKYGLRDGYDLYAGRKGFVDWVIKPNKEGGAGQTIENASIYCGHKSLDTTWTFYKDRISVNYQPTDYTESQKPKRKKKSG